MSKCDISERASPWGESRNTLSFKSGKDIAIGQRLTGKLKWHWRKLTGLASLCYKPGLQGCLAQQSYRWGLAHTLPLPITVQEEAVSELILISTATKGSKPSSLQGTGRIVES